MGNLYQNGRRVFCAHCGDHGIYYPKPLCTRNGMGQHICPMGHRTRLNPIRRTNRPRVDTGTRTYHKDQYTGPILPEGWVIESNYTPIPYAVLMAYFAQGGW